MKKFSKVLALAGLAFVLTFAVACSDDDDGDGGGGDASLDGASFSVGSKEFTEQIVLGQIAILALEDAGAEVEDSTGIAGTENVRAALTSGEIDMYWEYTGTGWSSHLGREISEAPESPEELAEAVAEADAAENDIIWYDTAPMNNTYALATLSSRSDELGVSAISEYAELVGSDAAMASLCGATEWLTRDDGLPGLEAAYGFDLPDDQIAEVELSLIAGLVADGAECNFGEVFATDGAIAANDLVVLEDDENFFVPYNVALTVRASVDDEYGDQLAEIFNPIAELLTDETMQGLNAQVDVDGEDPAAVAEQFLMDNGLLSE